MSRCRAWCAAFFAVVVLSLLCSFPATAQQYAQLIFPSGNEPRTGVQVGRHLELINNADYAGQAERFLNDMERAKKNCDKIAYDHAKRNLEALVQAAADRVRLLRNAVQGRATTVRVLFNLWRLPEDVTDLLAEQQRALEDVRALRRLANDAPRWVPCTPRTASAPCGPPGIGRAFVELKGAVGLLGSASDASYASTGAQAPFNGSFSNTGAQFGAGVAFFPGWCVGPAGIGFDLTIFNRPRQIFFSIPRHASGLVTLESKSLFVDLLVTAHVPIGAASNWFVSAGIGPTFRHLNLTLRSDQSAFAGGVPQASESKWVAGLAVMGGVSTFVCPNCIAGNPLRVGIEGRARFFPSQSVSLRSPVFGFTETGSTARTTDYSVLINASVVMFH